MMLLVNILTILILIAIFLQDVKERQVTLLLFIGLFVTGGFLYTLNSNTILSMLFNVFMNSTVVLIIFGCLFIYSKLKLKKNIFAVFGIGDLLFFFFMAISFPTTAFIILFAFSLFFSFAMSMILKNRLQGLIPLAGFQSLFLAIVLMSNQLFQFTNLYAY